MKLFFLLSSIVLLAACNNANTPKDTVNDFLRAIDNFEFEKANAFLVQTEENKMSLDNIKKYAASLADAKKQEQISKAKNRKYNFTNEESSGDNASVTVTNDEGQYVSVITFQLVKDRGKWMIESYRADAG